MFRSLSHKGACVSDYIYILVGWYTRLHCLFRIASCHISTSSSTERYNYKFVRCFGWCLLMFHGHKGLLGSVAWIFGIWTCHLALISSLGSLTMFSQFLSDFQNPIFFIIVFIMPLQALWNPCYLFIKYFNCQIQNIVNNRKTCSKIHTSVPH